MRFVLPSVADVMIPAAGGIRSVLCQREWTHINTHLTPTAVFKPGSREHRDRQTDAARDSDGWHWEPNVIPLNPEKQSGFKNKPTADFYYYYNPLRLIWCDWLVLRVVRLNRGVFGFTCSPSRGYGERWGWDGNETEGDRWRDDDDVTHMWQDGAALLVQREKHSNHQLTHTPTHTVTVQTHTLMTDRDISHVFGHNPRKFLIFFQNSLNWFLSMNEEQTRTNVSANLR